MAVEAINETGHHPESLVTKLETITERIRERAYALFENLAGGSAVDHWLQAERELLLTPQAELIEKEGRFDIRVAALGFRSHDISVTIMPDAVIVFAESSHQHDDDDEQVHLCEFGSKLLYRRFELPKAIDVEHVKVKLDDGILRLRLQHEGYVTEAANAESEEAD
jgi:HSP20 family molecular chaperone IbpA